MQDGTEKRADAIVLEMHFLERSEKMEYKFNDANFEAEVLKSELPVLVDFYADWCGPCKMMGPVVEAMAETFDGKMKIGKLNVDESQETAAKYGVMSIPTFIFFKNGEKVQQSVGAVSKEEFEQVIRNVIDK